jgi:hypothetical protein
MPDAVVLDAAKPGDDLPQMRGGAELESLRGHVADQVLGQDLGEARDVEDVFLRVEGHELPTEGRKRVDDPRGGAPHAGIECGEEAGRSSADDRDVPDLLFRHCRSRR